MNLGELPNSLALKLSKACELKAALKKKVWKLFIDHVVQWNVSVWEHCTCKEGGESIQWTPLQD